MKPIQAVALLLVALCGAAPASTAEKEAVRLSLEDALRMARTRNHQIRIAQNRVSEERGRDLESWSGFLPRVSIAGNYITSNDPVTVFGTKLKQGVFTEQDFDLQALNDPPEIDNFSTSFHLQQPILNVDAIMHKSAASSARKASEYALQRTEEAITLEVEKAYYALVLARLSVRAIERAVTSAAAHSREVEAAYRQGLVSEADLLASQVRLGELQEERLIALSSIANAGDGLRFLLGLERDQEIHPTDSLTVVDDSAWSDDDEAALDNRSDLLAMKYEEKAATRHLWMRRSEWVPRINAFGVVEWNDEDAFGNDRDNWTVGIQLEWNILDGLGRWGRARQAGARAAAAALRYDESRAKSRVEFRRALRAVKTSKERVKVTERAVAQARESLRIVEARFQEGMERTSDLLLREAAYTNAQLRLLQAKYDLNVAFGELKFYTGASLQKHE